MIQTETVSNTDSRSRPAYTLSSSSVAGWHHVIGTEERHLVHEDGREIYFDDVPPTDEEDRQGNAYLLAKWGNV